LSPAREVGHDDVFAEVQLGLEQDPPARAGQRLDPSTAAAFVTGDRERAAGVSGGH